MWGCGLWDAENLKGLVAVKTSQLNQFVDKIRNDQGLSNEVPYFDPKNGNENARFLFVLEAPGPKAVETRFISFDNPDQTAKNFKEQLEEAGINRSEIAIWNIVPWYLGNSEKTKIRAAKSRDIAQCLDYLSCHHPSLRVKNFSPVTAKENVAVFKALRN